MKKLCRAALQRESSLSFKGDKLPPKTAGLKGFEFTPSPGFLYITARAISSRVNANFDAWSPEGLRESYQSFIGKPVFVEHTNSDHRRTRGVILDAKLHEDRIKTANGEYPDVWVELLIEVDALAFPKLAQAIINGDIDAVSMGAEIEASQCSICGQIAKDASAYCDHIRSMKGRMVQITDEKTGSKVRKLCYEECLPGYSFFEISFVVDPADESADVLDFYLASGDSRVGSRRIQRHVRGASEDVETWRRRVNGISKAARKSYAAPISQTPCPQRRKHDGALCEKTLGHSGPHQYKEDRRYQDAADEAARKKSPTFQMGTSGSGVTTTITANTTGFNPSNLTITADQALMSLPQPVDTLRDEKPCPRCGHEWDSLVCQNCGYENPPDELDDPDTEPQGMTMEVRDEAQENAEMSPDESEETLENTSEEIDPETGEPLNQKGEPASDFEEKPDPEKSPQPKVEPAVDKKLPKNPEGDPVKNPAPVERDEYDRKRKDKKKLPPWLKNKQKGGSVSRYAELMRRYAEDKPSDKTSPYNDVAGETPAATSDLPDNEQTKNAPATIDVKNLDSNEVKNNAGEREVSVQGDDTDNAHEGQETNEGRQASIDRDFELERLAAIERARRRAIARRRALLEKQADEVLKTDVENLDSNPVSEDATREPDQNTDVTAPVSMDDQLEKADRPDTVQSPGGDEPPDSVRRQTNPHQDVGPYKGSAKVIRALNLVETREELGLSSRQDRMAEVARFEAMSDEALEAHIAATKEFKQAQVRVAGRRVSVAARKPSEEGLSRIANRMPSLGGLSSAGGDDTDEAHDFLLTL